LGRANRNFYGVPITILLLVKTPCLGTSRYKVGAVVRPPGDGNLHYICCKSERIQRDKPKEKRHQGSFALIFEIIDTEKKEWKWFRRKNESVADQIYIWY
jgi:hypothetical protein